MLRSGLTTSQFVTTPKQGKTRNLGTFGLTTSQFVTTPKPVAAKNCIPSGLTTSQFVTAPKRPQGRARGMKV